MKTKFFLFLMSLIFVVSVSVPNSVSGQSQSSVTIPDLTTNCESCGEGVVEKPTSSGNQEDQDAAVAVVSGQDEHEDLLKRVQRDGGSIELLSVNVIENETQATVVYSVDDPTDGLAVLTYYVDFETEEILTQKIYANEIQAGELVNLIWTLNDETVIDITLNSDGLVVVDDKEYDLDTFFEQYEEEIQSNIKDVVLPLGLCEWAVGLLCAAGTAGGCYALCGVAAIVNVIGGAGCAVACGVIFGGGGCIGGTLLICG